jgi:hypothetical protein
MGMGMGADMTETASHASSRRTLYIGVYSTACKTPRSSADHPTLILKPALLA